jgi:hypothetical protein
LIGFIKKIYKNFLSPNGERDLGNEVKKTRPYFK